MKQVNCSCVDCKRIVPVLVGVENFARFQSGNYKTIAEVFPNLEAHEREMFISGICNVCWQKLFKEEDNDEGLVTKLMETYNRKRLIHQAFVSKRKAMTTEEREAMSIEDIHKFDQAEVAAYHEFLEAREALVEEQEKDWEDGI